MGSEEWLTEQKTALRAASFEKILLKQCLVVFLNFSENRLLTLRGHLSINRLTNEGGGAASDEASRSREN
jgi:hypothetical protein